MRLAALLATAFVLMTPTLAAAECFLGGQHRHDNVLCRWHQLGQRIAKLRAHRHQLTPKNAARPRRTARASDSVGGARLVAPVPLMRIFGKSDADPRAPLSAR